MVGVRSEGEPVAAAEGEQRAIGQLERALAEENCRGVKLVGPEGEIVLPDSVRRVLDQVVRIMRQGQAVSVVPMHQELTTQEAADLLSIPRSALARLLDEGRLPQTRPGAHRRVRLSDVLAYRRQLAAERAQALAEITRISEESFSREAETAYYREMKELNSDAAKG